MQRYHDEPHAGEEDMLYTRIAHLEDDDVERLRSWLAALPARVDELRQSYSDQGTRHELFFLIRTRRRPILVLISEVEDVERATRSFLASDLPIDVEFKSLIQEISLAEAEVELLYDSAVHMGTAIV